MATDEIIKWERAPDQLILSEDEIHLWCTNVTEGLPILAQLQATLSDDEIARAQNYHFQRDRAAFMVARGTLRQILSRYVNIAPAALSFAYGTQGKPFLPDYPHCQFNVSHAEDLIVCAITKNHVLGIDVERIRPEFATEQIAEHFFSAREIQKLRSLPVNLQPTAFFNCWTRKEAYIKARAEGLSFPLDKFSVSLLPGEPPALLHVDDEPQEITRWSLHHLLPCPDFVGALCVAGTIPKYKYFPGDSAKTYYYRPRDTDTATIVP